MGHILFLALYTYLHFDARSHQESPVNISRSTGRLIYPVSTATVWLYWDLNLFKAHALTLWSQINLGCILDSTFTEFAS